MGDFVSLLGHMNISNGLRGRKLTGWRGIDEIDKVESCRVGSHGDGGSAEACSVHERGWRVQQGSESVVEASCSQ